MISPRSLRRHSARCWLTAMLRPLSPPRRWLASSLRAETTARPVELLQAPTKPSEPVSMPEVEAPPALPSPTAAAAAAASSSDAADAGGKKQATLPVYSALDEPATIPTSTAPPDAHFGGAASGPGPEKTEGAGVSSLPAGSSTPPPPTAGEGSGGKKKKTKGESLADGNWTNVRAC